MSWCPVDTGFCALQGESCDGLHGMICEIHYGSHGNFNKWTVIDENSIPCNNQRFLPPDFSPGIDNQCCLGKCEWPTPPPHRPCNFWWGCRFRP